MDGIDRIRFHTYITNHNGARQMISRIDREELLKDMVTDHLK